MPVPQMRMPRSYSPEATALADVYKRQALALAVMFFFPGMPMVYYGDEIGTEGGYDPDCRRCFRWDESSWDMELYGLVKRLAALRDVYKRQITSSGYALATSALNWAIASSFVMTPVA